MTGRGPVNQFRQHGSVYFAVLGVSMIVVTLGIGGILLARVQLRTQGRESDLAEARLQSQSAMELARLWIQQDSNWRATRTNGAWTQGLALGSGSISISVVDPNDSDLINAAHDPIRITTIGYMGRAQHRMVQYLEARPIPLSTLAYAIHSNGQLRVRPGRRIEGWGAYSTNGSLRNEGVIVGSVVATSINTAGTVADGITTGQPSRPMPPSSVIDYYADRGTTISTTSVEKQVLAPGYSSFGTANPQGIYVIRSSSDVVIKNSRIYGTLVIIAPGRKVTLDNELFMHSASSSQPVLIIDGDLEIKCSGADKTLSESGTGVNFNPAGAPYNGSVDGDKSDVYPCEIRGLVHVTGAIKMTTNAVFRGVLVSSSDASPAIEVDANVTFAPDSTIYSTPPVGYTSSVPMVPISGSINQVVD